MTCLISVTYPEDLKDNAACASGNTEAEYRRLSEEELSATSTTRTGVGDFAATCVGC
jgi:hypothetical protein